MAGISFEKLVSALPPTLTPNTVYFVKNGQGFDTYVSDNAGTNAYKQNGSDESIEPFLLMGAGNA